MVIPVGSVIGRAGLASATLSISSTASTALATPSSYTLLTTLRSSLSSDPTSQPQQHTIALPLGLGLGLGIPLGLVLIGTLFYFARQLHLYNRNVSASEGGQAGFIAPMQLAANGGSDLHELSS